MKAPQCLSPMLVAKVGVVDCLVRMGRRKFCATVRDDRPLFFILVEVRVLRPWVIRDDDDDACYSTSRDAPFSAICVESTTVVKLAGAHDRRQMHFVIVFGAFLLINLATSILVNVTRHSACYEKN